MENVHEMEPSDSARSDQADFVGKRDADALHVAHPFDSRGNAEAAGAADQLHHRVAWVRISDLINSGTGRLAGRGIDFEAELARRLREPAAVTRRAVRDRSASLPPLSAFGVRQPLSDRRAMSRQ